MKYVITITRECTESTNVDVTANSPAEAVEKALADASRDFGSGFTWAPDDCSGVQSEPYFPGDISEVEPEPETGPETEIVAKVFADAKDAPTSFEDENWLEGFEAARCMIAVRIAGTLESAGHIASASAYLDACAIPEDEEGEDE